MAIDKQKSGSKDILVPLERLGITAGRTVGKQELMRRAVEWCREHDIPVHIVRPGE